MSKTIDPQATVMMIRDLADVVRNLAGRFLLAEGREEVEILPTLRSSVATLARFVWSAEGTHERFPGAFKAEFHERYDDFWNLLVLITALDRAIEHPDENPIGVSPAARSCASVAESVAERFVTWADALEVKYDPGVRLQEVAHV